MSKQKKVEKRPTIAPTVHNCQSKEVVLNIPVAPTVHNRQSKEVVINIPVEWIDKRCIYTVPKNLRNLKAEDYTPQLISIGPIHQGNKNLAAMEKHKEKYLNEFCERPEMKLKGLIHQLESDTWTKHVEAIRSSYTEESMFDRNKYNMKMIVLDAVFIIELFLRDFKKKKQKEEKEEKKEKEKEKEKKCSLLFTLLSMFPFFHPKKENEDKEKKEKKEKEKEKEEEELYPDDYLLKNQWLKNGIQHDLLLLENQLPYFFLNQLYTSAFPPNSQPTFRELTGQYFKEYNRHSPAITEETKILHFTDLLRYFMSNNHPTATEKSSRTIIQVNAAKLHEAGVEFEVNKEACLTDIKFNKGKLKGKLKMPQFDVDNTTERVIRNLVAYEQLHYSSEAYISYYIFLMDCLIDTAEDVELLIEKGIIVNWLGSSKEVAKLVNNLYINITKYNSCYHDICDDLNKYYNSSFPRIMAKLHGVYFSDIWRGTATVAAGILLVLTFIQTVNSYLALP